MKLVEMFTSIEGEGIRAGALCTFIRFRGCNLKCSYCDTTYAFDGDGSAEEDIEISIPEIITFCKEANTPYVTITGGEPLLRHRYAGLVALLKHMQLVGLNVNIETNGSIAIPLPEDRYGEFYTVDFKSISSGESDKMLLTNFKPAFGSFGNLTSDDVIKFVIGTNADLDQMADMLYSIERYWTNPTANHFISCGFPHIYISPVFGLIDSAIIVERLKRLAKHFSFMSKVKIQLQLHKYIWPAEQKGV